MKSRISFAQCTQVAVFSLFCFEFLSFSFGWIHVPTNPEDSKFFYMIFGILNTILCVPALVTKINTDDGTTGTVVINTPSIPSSPDKTSPDKVEPEATEEETSNV